MPRKTHRPGEPLPSFQLTPRPGAGVAASVRAAEGGEGGKPKLPTFEGLAYTGDVMEPGGWFGPIIVDLDGVKVPNQHRPALRQHDHEQIVGHTFKVTVENPKGITVAGVFSGEKQHTDKVTVPAGNGFEWQMSIGATPLRTEFLEAGKEAEVNGRTVVGPIDISRETELGEVSFVPLGADGNTSATVTASRGRIMRFKAMLKSAKANGSARAAKFSDEAIDGMDEEEAKAALKECMAEDDPPAEAEDGEDVDAEGEADDVDAEDEEPKKAESSRRGGIRGNGKKKVTASRTRPRPEITAAQRIADDRKAFAAEARRVAKIKATGAKYPGVMRVKLDDGTEVPDLLVHALECGMAADKYELYALRSYRPGPGVGVPGGLAYSTSTPEATEAVLEAAVLHASRHQFKLADDDFYHQPTPDGKGQIRRVPAYLQQAAQGELKARYTDQVQQAAHTMFKGRIGLHQIIRAGFSTWGYGRQLDMSGEGGVRDMLAAWDHFETQSRIRAEGASNVSISNILSNVLNKFSLQGYLFTEQAWREFCAIRSVNDFKASKSINLLGDVMFKAIGPTGELANASIGDQAFANQANPFGRILTLPYTHIVNDDLGMLATAPQKMGQGAGLALNDAIWTLKAAMYAGTTTGDDGLAFYRTTSSMTAAAKRAGTAYGANKVAGAPGAFSDAGLKAAKALFDNQIDPNGNPLGFDGLTPILLHGPSLWRDVTAQMMAPAIVYGGGTAANAPNANPWAGGLKPVMSRYIENASYGNTATGWEVLYNPAALATIEVAFLNGVDTPAVLTAGPDYQFDRLGISIRGTMPFGVTQQNFRGGVYCPGA